MDRLNCFVCKKSVENGLDGLVHHFKSTHGLTVNRGYGQSGIECGQDGCRRRFSLYSSLRKHIKSSHLNRINYQEATEDADDPVNAQLRDGEAIDGRSIFKLTDEDLKDIGIKMGPRKNLSTFIHNCNMAHGKQIKILNFEMEQHNEAQINEDTQIVMIPRSCLPQQAIEVADFNCQPEPQAGPSNAYSSCSEINVRAILNKSIQGDDYIDKLENGQFTEKERRPFVRILVAELVKTHGTHYPPDEAKWALAKSIVREFPILKDQQSEYGCEHYFDKKTRTGFIEYRLTNARKNLPAAEKKYRKFKSTKPLDSLVDCPKLLSYEELEKKITTMKLTMPKEAKAKNKIIEYLGETFFNRRKWIQEKGPPISKIVEVYPRLLDFDGHMIELEYDALKKEEGKDLTSDAFIGGFPTEYAPAINAYCMKYANNIFAEASLLTKDENLRALIMLPEILPNANFTTGIRTTKKSLQKSTKGTKRKNMDDDTNCQEEVTDTYKPKSRMPNSDLIVFLQDGSNVDSFVRESRKKAKSAIQPYIICIRGRIKNSFFIQLDGHFVQMDLNTNPINAFDLLFKVHYVFNVHFAKSLKYFYNFIEYYIYKSTEHGLSSVKSLFTSLRNVPAPLIYDNPEDNNEWE